MSGPAARSTADLPFRHLCLDFHTSPLISDVGSSFQADAWAATLAAARVNWITLHTKCHHGFCYHPTAVGAMHPGLRFDLFGAMIEACRRSGIRVEAYISVVWDERMAELHPEWLQVDGTGRPIGRGPLDLAGRWRWLCLDTPYVDYVAAHTEEVIDRYRPDGLLYDIVCQTRPGCCCPACLRSMRGQQVDPRDASALALHSIAVERAFMDRMSRLVRSKLPDATLWYNVRTLLAHRRADGIGAELPLLSHVELESLPSGIWGYNHFPLHVRYLAGLGAAVKGQTGRFHRSWGDFGGLKNRAALEYECLTMLAHGVACSVGDQMHPRGELDQAVYERIGSAYRRVEELEPWCRGAELLADIAVLAASGSRPGVSGKDSDEGALRVLEETHSQFHVIDRDADFARYRVLVAPDIVPFDAELAAKVAAYLEQGGNLLLSGESGLAPQQDRFALDQPALHLSGAGGFVTTYFRARIAVSDGIEDTPQVVYERALDVEAGPDAEVLADRIDPYFDRTPEHFCSHAQTPPDRLSRFAAAARRGRLVQIAFPVFRLYLRNGNRAYKLLARNCLRLLLPRPLLRSNAPSTARITLLRQAREDRLICHLTHAIPERRTKSAGVPTGPAAGWLEPQEIDIIEDEIPLFGVEVAVRAEARPKRVALVPSRAEVPYTWADGYARFVVPEVRTHQVVVFEC